MPPSLQGKLLPQNQYHRKGQHSIRRPNQLLFPKEASASPKEIQEFKEQRDSNPLSPGMMKPQPFLPLVSAHPHAWKGQRSPQENSVQAGGLGQHKLNSLLLLLMPDDFSHKGVYQKSRPSKNACMMQAKCTKSRKLLEQMTASSWWQPLCVEPGSQQVITSAPSRSSCPPLSHSPW